MNSDDNFEESADGDDDGRSESGESWNSEDDPERLWCVCRKPHNNMFMICCDKCSDWFHGRCVKITRSMARELIDNGLDFICPKCVRQEQGLESPPKREVWNLVISEKLNVLYIFFEYFIYVYEKKESIS